MADALHFMYIGPNSKKYGLMRNTIYEGGIPPYVLHAIAEVPEVSLLVVKVDTLNDKLAKCRRRGTPEFRACEVVAGLRD